MTATRTNKRDQQYDNDNNLLDPKIMDGPKVEATVGDLFKSHPKLFLPYHAMSAGYSILTPVGSLLGGLLYYTAGVGSSNTTYPSSVLAVMGTSGLLAGSAGMVLGLAKLLQLASQGENASPIPFTTDGIQQRVDGLSHNFMVRILDKSVWLGAAAGCLIVAGAGGPKKVGLSAGAFGVLQAISLGSAVGTLSAIGCVASTKKLYSVV